MHSKGLTSNGLKNGHIKKKSFDSADLFDNLKKTETDMSVGQQSNGHANDEETDHKELVRRYDNYLDALDNVKNIKPDLLKRTFDDYHDHVENEFTQKMNEDMCRRLAEISNCHDLDSNVKLHQNHNESMLKVLGAEEYVFFKVLYMHWVREELERKDICLLTPCKLYIFQSLIKRKYEKTHVYS